MNRLTIPVISTIMLGLLGCAPATQGENSPGQRPASIVRTGAGYQVTLSSDSRASRYDVAVPPEQVWEALLDVYQELDVPLGTFNPSARTVGNREFVIMRRFAGEKVSRFLDCGLGTVGTPNADNYRVRLSLLTSLTPTPDGGTEIETRVGASATSNEGASTAAVQCSSTGHLEQHIAELVAQRVES